MAGLVQGIHVLFFQKQEDVDALDKAGMTREEAIRRGVTP
jgi:hypothetical protein